MPGNYVEQLVLRCPITDATRPWCVANLGVGRGLVVLYCTSTFRQDPMRWEVYAQIDSTALMGAQAYAFVGIMPDVVQQFYGWTIETLTSIIVGGRRQQIEWSIYPEQVWGWRFIAHGRYMRNYNGDVDFYFQDGTCIGTAFFHHLICYGVPREEAGGLADLDFWYLGERRYIRSVIEPGWVRPPQARY